MIENSITEAQLLLNQEVIVTGVSRFRGRRGRVNRIMADGRTLDITLDDDIGDVFLDVSLVGEIKNKPGHYSDGCCHEKETDEETQH